MADLAQRLDCTGRRIVVLAGPGDRRDEDLRAIADAVAGRFDHYICRRDDSLRDRAPDEVPKLQAAQLMLRGVPQSAISIIPDELEAIEAALNMGQPGDLLLVFADALIRSWKQITKFKSATSPAAAGEAARSAADGTSGIGGFMADAPTSHAAAGEVARSAGEGPNPAAKGAPIKATTTARKPVPPPPSPPASPPDARDEAGAGREDLMPGIIRDERGVWIAPEAED
jgi:hypothetical protein